MLIGVFEFHVILKRWNVCPIFISSNFLCVSLFFFLMNVYQKKNVSFPPNISVIIKRNISRKQKEKKSKLNVCVRFFSMLFAPSFWLRTTATEWPFLLLHRHCYRDYYRRVRHIHHGLSDVNLACMSTHPNKNTHIGKKSRGGWTLILNLF